MMNEFESDFFGMQAVRLLSIVRRHGKPSADISLVSDLLERGKNYIMSWLKDVNLKEKFQNDPMMYYYNIACFAFDAGVAYADAWQKDVSQVKIGIVDTLIASQPDINALATDLLGLDEGGKTNYRQMKDEMFSEFLDIMEPYWEKEDPRPFLFQGLLAFFQSGINYKMA